MRAVFSLSLTLLLPSDESIRQLHNIIKKGKKAKMEKVKAHRYEELADEPKPSKTKSWKSVIPQAFVNVLLAVLVLDKVFYNTSFTYGLSSWYSRIVDPTEKVAWDDASWESVSLSINTSISSQGLHLALH